MSVLDESESPEDLDGTERWACRYCGRVIPGEVSSRPCPNSPDQQHRRGERWHEPGTEPLTRASEAPEDAQADSFWRTLHGYYLTNSGDVGLCMSHAPCDQVVLVLDDMERTDTEVGVLAALIEAHEYHVHGRNTRFAQPPF